MRNKWFVEEMSAKEYSVLCGECLEPEYWDNTAESGDVYIYRASAPIGEILKSLRDAGGKLIIEVENENSI